MPAQVQGEREGRAAGMQLLPCFPSQVHYQVGAPFVHVPDLSAIDNKVRARDRELLAHAALKPAQPI